MKANSADNPFRRAPIAPSPPTAPQLTVFQCAECQTIIGNSLSLSKIIRPRTELNSPYKSFLLFSSLDNVVSFSDEILFDQEGYFKFCTFKAIRCQVCHSKLGMLFIATSRGVREFMDSYCITESSIISYTLGETPQISAARTRSKVLKDLKTNSPNQQVSSKKERRLRSPSTPLPPPPNLEQEIQKGKHKEEAKEDKRQRSPIIERKIQRHQRRQNPAMKEINRGMKGIHEFLVKLDEKLDQTQKEVDELFNRR